MKSNACSDVPGSTRIIGSQQVIVIDRAEECKRFDGMLGKEHFLGERRPSGHSLRQVVVQDGQWVGLLLWVAGFWHLQDRDEWIKWDAVTRAERLKLIVHNARFLVPEAAREPNRASHVLGLALVALPRQWQERFGYQPLLAETFTDVERHDGTIYRVTGWIAVGKTAQGEHRCDHFPDYSRPKQLWLKPLHPQAQQRLSAPELLPEHQAAENDQVTTRCPLNQSLCTSLWSALRQVPDPRARAGRRYPLGALLVIVALGLLRGAVHLSTIYRTGLKLDQRQRGHIGLPFKRGTRFRPAPGYFAYRDVLAALDLERLAEVLTAWLQAHAGQLPRTLAADGKIIRDHLGLIVTLVDTEEGTPVAVMATTEGKGHELKTAQKLLASRNVNLHNATVTTDSLHCQDQTVHQIVLEKGGDYLVQVRDNQPTIHTHAQTKLAQATPFLSKPKVITAATRFAKSVAPR
jgi:hypothetical protein